MIYLVADIGGTNSRLALADTTLLLSTQSVQLTHIHEFKNSAFDCFDDVMQQYLTTLDLKEDTSKLRHVCLGVAGPISTHQKGAEHTAQATLSNLNWTLDTEKLQKRFNFQKVQLANDFSCVAASLPFLTPDLLLPICGPHLEEKYENPDKKPIATIGPGTGLGMGFSIYHKNQWIQIASEGGNTGFTPSNSLEVALLQYASAQEKFISKEYFLSGRGIVFLYESLCNISDQPNTNTLANANRSPANITAAALNNSDPIAVQTMAVFWDMIASQAADLALTTAAQGGVFLAGGILPKIQSLLNKQRFETCFLNKGSFREYMAQIDCLLISANSYCGLRGAAIKIRHDTIQK